MAPLPGRVSGPQGLADISISGRSPACWVSRSTGGRRGGAAPFSRGRESSSELQVGDCKSALEGDHGLGERGKKLVGAPRFELGTPCTPCKCATRLRHAPTRLFFFDYSAQRTARSGTIAGPLSYAVLSAAGDAHRGSGGDALQPAPRTSTGVTPSTALRAPASPASQSAGSGSHRRGLPRRRASDARRRS